MANSPLHLAVLHDDLAAISLLQNNPELLLRKNGMGLSSLELAYLLGKQKAIKLLADRVYPPIVIQQKEDIAPRYCNRAEFEKIFNIRYLQTPYFESLELLQQLAQNCPWLLRHTFFGLEHRMLGAKLHRPLFQGYVADVAIKWISDTMGYGLFAQNFIAKESFIGQYTGIVRKVKRFHPELNGYCMHIPTKFCSFRYFIMDAMKGGNELRFCNHAERPTLKPFCLVVGSLVHIGLFAIRDIEPGEELTFNYGKDYWKTRKLENKGIGNIGE